MAVAIDGNVHKEEASTSAFVFPGLTTTAAGKVLVAFCYNFATVSSVVGSTLGSFTKRAEAGNLGTNTVELWEKTSASPVTGEVITATVGGTGFSWAGAAFGVSGTSGFDIDASLPDEGSTDPRTISTTAASTMVFGIFRYASVASPAVPSGWTSIVNEANSYFGVFYKLFASSQSGLSVPVAAANTGDSNGAIGDAVYEVSGDPLSGGFMFVMP